MNPLSNRRTGYRRFALLLALAVSSLGCDETPPTAATLPTTEPSEQEPAQSEPPLAAAIALACVASLRDPVLECSAPDLGSLAEGASAVVIGGQELNVRLHAADTEYDAGSGIFTSTVTVQNLTKHLLGTPDGTTVEGVKVFFAELPNATAGSGEIKVSNPSGHETFTGPNQPYFDYPQILEPLEISAGERWEFEIPATVEAFTFTVFVSAPTPEGVEDLLGAVWTGAAGSDWFDPANWVGGEVPDSALDVTIPARTLLAPEALDPELNDAAAVQNLRVGEGSQLELGGVTLRVLGSLDVVGEIAGGTVKLEGEKVIVAGWLPAVQISGNARLQGPAVLSGPLVVEGSLVAAGAPITITIP